MRYLVLAIGLTVGISVHAQFGSMGDKPIKKLKNAELLVLLNDQSTSPYNEIIEEAMLAEWNYSKLKFIKRSDLNSYCNGNSVYFLDLINITETGHEYSQQMLTIICTKKDGGKYDTGDFAAYSHLKTAFGDEKVKLNPKEFKAQIIRSINMIQLYANVCNTHKISRTETYLNQLTKIYSENKGDVKKNKVLLIEKDWDPEKSQKVIDKVYPYPYEIVSANRIADAILNKEEGVVYEILLQAKTNRITLLVQAKDNSILYVNRNYGTKKMMKMLSK